MEDEVAVGLVPFGRGVIDHLQEELGGGLQHARLPASYGRAGEGCDRSRFVTGRQPGAESFPTSSLHVAGIAGSRVECSVYSAGQR